MEAPPPPPLLSLSLWTHVTLYALNACVIYNFLVTYDNDITILYAMACCVTTSVICNLTLCVYVCAVETSFLTIQQYVSFPSASLSLSQAALSVYVVNCSYCQLLLN